MKKFSISSLERRIQSAISSFCWRKAQSWWITVFYIRLQEWLNRPLIDVEIGTRKKAQTGAREQEYGVKKTGASEADMVPESANERAKVPKFALEELEMLK